MLAKPVPVDSTRVVSTTRDRIISVFSPIFNSRLRFCFNELIQSACFGLNKILSRSDKN